MICKPKTTTRTSHNSRDIHIPSHNSRDIHIPSYVTVSFSIQKNLTPPPPPILLTVIGAGEWATDRAIFVRVINADRSGPSTRDDNENAHENQKNVEDDERSKAQGCICFAVTPVIIQPHPA